jgi:hypothetical protein
MQDDPRSGQRGGSALGGDDLSLDDAPDAASTYGNLNFASSISDTDLKLGEESINKP